MKKSYKEYSVDPRLSSYVACYWTSEFAEDFRGTHPVLPDGCIDLLFESQAERLNVVGTMTRTLWVRDVGPNRFVGIRFRPGGAIPFLRDRADVLTDNFAEADCVFGRAGTNLRQRLLEGGSLAEQVRLFEGFLMARLQADATAVDSTIAWATAKLANHPGTRIDLLARERGLSRQYLRRLFLQHTGLSPKAFARVARLGRLAASLPSGAPLAHTALACGYSDQAHMSHEFKELVGITLTAYRNR